MFWDNVCGILDRTGRETQWLRRHLGVSQSTMSTWRSTDRIPKLPVVLEIARLLETTVEYLMTGEERDPYEDLDPLTRQVCHAVMALSEHEKTEVLIFIHDLAAQRKEGTEREPREDSAV